MNHHQEGVIMSQNARESALILLADDDWMNREMLEAQFQHAGYAVLCATGGEEALRLAEQHPPDLAVLDVHMQGMNGYSLCTQLKARRPLPVVLMTAQEDEQVLSAARQAGADAVVFRSHPSAELLMTIATLLT